MWLEYFGKYQAKTALWCAQSRKDKNGQGECSSTMIDHNKLFGSLDQLHIKAWLQIIERNDLKDRITRNNEVCSIHFKRSHLTPSGSRLLKTAVPTRCLPSGKKGINKKRKPHEYSSSTETDICSGHTFNAHFATPVTKDTQLFASIPCVFLRFGQ